MVSTKHYEHSCGRFSTYNEDQTRYDDYYHHDIFYMTTKTTTATATSGLIMAEEGGRNGAGGEGSQEANVGTSDSRGRDHGMGSGGGDGDEGWLQLGVGSGSSSSRSTNVFPETFGDRTASTLQLELNLFSDRPAVTSIGPPSSTSFTTAAVATGVPSILPMSSYTPGYSRDMSWGWWNVAGAGTSSTTVAGWINDPQKMPPSVSYLPRHHHQQQRQLMYVSGSRSSSLDFPAVGVERRTQGGGGHGEEISVINRPSRPPIGLWFVLQASHENQPKESLLPQIPKSYLRIKDASMTIRLLMKYLVSKLDGLVKESEVVITCKGHVLQPYLTLQHVRDNIWCARNVVVAALPDSTANHVMTLQYRRSTAAS